MLSLSQHSIHAWIQENQLKNEKGDPIEFKDHLFLYDIYSDRSPNLVVVKAAQVGLSTLEVLKNLYDARHNKMDIIYTLPTDNDVNLFVGGKVNRIIAQNPILLQYTKDKDSVEQKQIGESMIYFRGTWTKKAAIMVTADRIVNDEKDASKQDVVKDYEARTQHSKFKHKHVFSHPSVPNFGVDVEWQQSDQKHWFITCTGCKKEQYLSWNTEDETQMSIDIKRRIFVCKHCGKELTQAERRRGRWKKKVFRDENGKVIPKKYSGYWVSLLMCPWVSAGEIIDKYEDKDSSPEFFTNKVLGLPYVGSGNKMTKDVLDRNLTPDHVKHTSRVVVGVDTGLGVHLVAGNRDGLFYHSSTQNYDDFERVFKLYPDAIAVFDAQGDLQKPRELAEKYPGRIFFCYYREDRKSKQLVSWGRKKDEGTVVVDRNKMIQLVIDEFTLERIPLHGTQEDWHDYWLHWNNIFRIKEENNLGVMVSRWKRAGADHLVHATCYWRTGMQRFGEKGALIEAGPTHLPPGTEIQPDGRISRKLIYPQQAEEDWRTA